MDFSNLQPIDYVSYILVAALTIGGIILAIVSLVRSQAKKQHEQAVHDSTGVYIPQELAKLDPSEYIVLRRPLYMTLMGKSRGSHLVISIYGIFIVEYSIESGKIGGRFGNSHWHKATAMGMGSRSLTSPMWRALVHHLSLIKGLPEIDQYPFFPMAVFPNGTRIDIHLNPYRLEDELEEEEKEEEEEEFTQEELDAIELTPEEIAELEAEIAAEEAGEDLEEDEDAEDLEVEYDPTKFVGCIEDITEFIADNSLEQVMTFAEAQDLAKKCEAYFAEVKEMEEPEIQKGRVPVEYLGFTRDYHNKKHLKELEEEGVILVGKKSDLDANRAEHEAAAAAKREAAAAKREAEEQADAE
jgi:hypothetical protein